jgi:hypothetical protein
MLTRRFLVDLAVRMPLKPFTFQHWHAWQGTAKVMLSNEQTKKLQEFATVDAAVNWLFSYDRPAARALNAHHKGYSNPEKAP